MSETPGIVMLREISEQSEIVGQVPVRLRDAVFEGVGLAVGRGVGYANVREAGLKIIEAACIPTLSCSVADLLHGPIALADPAPLTIMLDHAGPDSTALPLTGGSLHYTVSCKRSHA